MLLAFVFSLEPASVVLAFLVLALLLLASAVFSGSEVALFSLDMQAKETLSAEADRASQRVLYLLQHPRRLLYTILVLNTAVNVAAAIIAALLTEQFAERIGAPGWAVVLAEVVALTFVLLVVSEISPKLIAARNAIPYSRFVAGPLLVWVRLLQPLTFALDRLVRLFQRLVRTEKQQLSGDDVKAIAEIGEAHGSLEENERALIHSIVEFGDTTVREIMVARVDIISLPITATMQDAFDLIREKGHSRIPLYIGHLDAIQGVIYAKDLLRYIGTESVQETPDWTRLARPAMFVPPGKKLDDLLEAFQTQKTHIAIVVDEYGGTAGLVTLENVLEEIVGDIRDEHDEVESDLIEQLDANTYRCDARLDLDDLNEHLDLALDTEEFDFETLGGLLFDQFGAIPEPGDTTTYENLHLEVETIDQHRIGLVRVEIAPEAPSSDEAV